MKTLMMIAICFLGLGTFAQDNSGAIKGQLIDTLTNEGIPYANVRVMLNGAPVGGVTDFDGKFMIKPLPSGTYDLICSHIEYGTRTLESIEVSTDKITFVDDIYMAEGNLIKGYEKIVFSRKLIDPDNVSRVSIDSKDIVKSPIKNNINKLAETLGGGVKVSDDGKQIYFRGSRNGNVIYLVDGVKIRGGSPSIPSSGIKSMAVYTGGVPAKYGDTTGGVIVVETKSYFDLYYASLRDKK